MLTVLEERLSYVPRWALIRTIQKQSVSDHLFRVALVAPRFAEKYWQIYNHRHLLDVVQYALKHDNLESVSSDIPSMVKDCVDEWKLTERYPEVERAYVDEIVEAVVKAADLYEAAVFLSTEIAMGNRVVDDCRSYILNKLYAHCYHCGKPELYEDCLASMGEFQYGQIQHMDRKPTPAPITDNDDDDIPF